VWLEYLKLTRSWKIWAAASEDVSDTIEEEKSTENRTLELNQGGSGETREKVSRRGTGICNEEKIALV
jgi:hypothetical protein